MEAKYTHRHGRARELSRFVGEKREGVKRADRVWVLLLFQAGEEKVNCERRVRVRTVDSPNLRSPDEDPSRIHESWN
jgi:hypothetical protein